MSDRLRALPKIELHRHLDGSVRLDTIRELAQHHAIDLGIKNEADFIRKTKIKTPMASLNDVLECFWTTQKVMVSYEALKRIAFENVEDCFRDGCVLAELRFAPSFIAHGKNIANDEIIEGVMDGIAEGMKRYPIQIGAIGILARRFDFDKNTATLDDLLRFRHRYDRLVGLDLADSEDDESFEKYGPLVEKARKAGLGITIHSGENTSATYMKKTIDMYHPKRIGHGIRAIDDRALMDRLKDLDIHLEVSPTSNWLTHSVPSLEEHPLPHLLKYGVACSINSDDPHLMNIDLVNEYAVCETLFGFKDRNFMAINRMVLPGSFLDADVKRMVAKHFA